MSSNPKPGRGLAKGKKRPTEESDPTDESRHAPTPTPVGRGRGGPATGSQQVTPVPLPNQNIGQSSRAQSLHRPPPSSTARPGSNPRPGSISSRMTSTSAIPLPPLQQPRMTGVGQTGQGNRSSGSPVPQSPPVVPVYQGQQPQQVAMPEADTVSGRLSAREILPHADTVSAGSGRRSQGNTPSGVSPGTPGVGAQQLNPSSFWEPTRANLIRLQSEAMPALRWDAVNRRCVPVTEHDDPRENDAVILPEPDLPQDATAQEAREIKRYVHLMLFVWHSPGFVGYYARMVNPSVPTNSARFVQTMNTMKSMFKSEKTHFLWRYAYGWVKELAHDRPEVIALQKATDSNSQAKLQDILLSKLDNTSFQAIFHHVRYEIDFGNTKSRRDQNGFYFIKTVYVNLVMALLQLLESESALNPTDEEQPGPSNSSSSAKRPAWKKDQNLRETIRHDFAAWGLMDEFRNVGARSFAMHAPEMEPASSTARINIQSARQNFIVLEPPPPAPSSEGSASPNPFGFDGAMDDLPIPFALQMSRVRRAARQSLSQLRGLPEGQGEDDSATTTTMSSFDTQYF